MPWNDSSSHLNELAIAPDHSSQAHHDAAAPTHPIGKAPEQPLAPDPAPRGLNAADQAIRMVAGGAASIATRSVTATLTLVASAGRLLRPQQRAKDELTALLDASRYSAISRRLTALAGLTPEEASSVRRSTPSPQIHQAGTEVVGEGENVSRPMMIASGWACRVRTTGVNRQIIGLLLPGDGIALRSGAGSLSSTTIAALTTVETVDASPLLDMAEDAARNPGICAAMHRVLSLEEEFVYNQVARLGSMTAPQRISHLLLELHWRLRQSGLATASEAVLPLDDATLGNLLAIKPRALSRIMRAFQRENLMRNRRGRISLRDRNRLRGLCGFVPPPPLARPSSRRLIRDIGVPSFIPANVAATYPPPAVLPGRGERDRSSSAG